MQWTVAAPADHRIFFMHRGQRRSLSMNLVKQITEQLNDETLGKLSSLLGTDQETAGAAATATVPTLLAGLAGMASRPEGAKKLTDTLSGIDTSSFGNLAQLLGGDTSSLLGRG